MFFNVQNYSEKYNYLILTLFIVSLFSVLKWQWFQNN